MVVEKKTSTEKFYFIKAQATKTRDPNLGQTVTVWLCMVRGMTDNGQPAFSTYQTDLMKFDSAEEARLFLNKITPYGWDFDNVREQSVFYTELTVETITKKTTIPIT